MCSADGSSEIELPQEGVVGAPVIAAMPARIAPVVIGGRGGPTRPISVQRIAHASVLLDFDGARILTDPWFTESPEYHHGEPLAVAAADLPPLAAIVASHAHFDHYDIENFGRALAAKDTPLFVGFDDMVERAHAAGFTDVRRLAPGEEDTVGGVTILALPGEHVVPEITFLLSGGGNTVYFGADTLLSPPVRTIPERVGRVDLALLAVNGLNVAGKPAVMSAEEAAVFAGMLQAAVAVPIHYRFRGGPKTQGVVLTYNGDPDRFLRSLAISAPETVAVVLEPGQVLALQHAA